MEKFYIHINKKNHYLSVDEYTQAIKSAKIIFENINNDILGIGGESEIVVYAPQEGCIIAILGLIVGSTGVLISFMNSEYGKVFIKELTGNEPIYYAKKHAELIKDLMKAIYTKPQKDIKNLIEKLKELNINIVKLDKSLKSKSDFFKICQDNDEITEVGFELAEQFPIKRNEFGYHLTKDLVRNLDDIITYKELVIVRPVAVDRYDKWYLEDINTKELKSYYMDDSIFQGKTLAGNFLKQSKQDDRIVVKIEYIKELKNGVETIKERLVKDVYELNGEKIKEKPADFELEKIELESNQNNQLNFFGESSP